MINPSVQFIATLVPMSRVSCQIACLGGGKAHQINPVHHPSHLLSDPAAKVHRNLIVNKKKIKPMLVLTFALPHQRKAES